jgi:hypothetical protein
MGTGWTLDGTLAKLCCFNTRRIVAPAGTLERLEVPPDVDRKQKLIVTILARRIKQSIP